jgi:threonine dehydratase
MRRLGADVLLVPRDGDDKAAARAMAAETGALLIEDGAHPEIAAGAGTIAMELTAQGDSPEAVVVQVGDGALVSGVGSWFKA